MLGGSGAFENLLKDLPFSKKPAYFDYYFIGSLGYNIESLLVHSCRTARNDFIEMILHHVATVSLIVFSYLGCFDEIGAVILWLHCWSDIFTSGARAFMDIKSHTREVFYAGILLTWFYARIWAFLLILVRVFTFDVSTIRGIPVDETRTAFWAFNYFLWVLYTLHVFWFYKFLEIGYGMVFKSRYEDTIQPVPNKKQW